jgi:hypothetical protein
MSNVLSGMQGIRFIPRITPGADAIGGHVVFEKRHRMTAGVPKIKSK